MPVGFNCPTVDLKPFKLAVTCIIPVDLNLVVAVFDQNCALASLLKQLKNQTGSNPMSRLHRKLFNPGSVLQRMTDEQLYKLDDVIIHGTVIN